MNELKISKNGRYFTCGEKPWFWLGDTAWLLYQKLNPDERRRYFRNRAEKGFTVLQVSPVHERGIKNPAGSPALIGDDFSRPNPDLTENGFWRQVRDSVEEAASLGLTVALLPAWGSMVKDGLLTEGNADAYTDFLSQLLGGYGNLIWIVGGDVRGSVAPNVFDAIGNALRKKCPRQLIGYHPFGRDSSSLWFHDRKWLDFNMFQSGHRDYGQIKMNAWDDKVDKERWVGEDNYLYVAHDRALSPVKPTLDGEPSYELIPHGLHDGTRPYWQAKDVRRYAYWSMLAGSAGHTYGDNAIMQFYREGDTPYFSVIQTWDTALHNPGGMQMGHMRRLMTAMRWYEGEPFQQLLPDNGGREHDSNRAMLSPVAALCYIYNGKPFSVDVSALPFRQADVFWFDPAIGGVSFIEETEAKGTKLYTPPDRRSDHNDWLLLFIDQTRSEEFLRTLETPEWRNAL